jgi:hypothetical protein
MLTPRVSLREPYSWPADDADNDEPQHLNRLVDWEITLSTDHVHTGLRDLPKDDRWTESLPELLTDFSSLLRDALDLMRELGGADDTSDLSYIHQPSISEHPQNTDFHDWTALIDLARDAWLVTAAQSPAQARLAAEAWWGVPYPVFRRLSFFAATQGNVIPQPMALNWLLADKHRWLWSVEAEREAMRLLVHLAPRLDVSYALRLEKAVLEGPPRSMFRDDLEPERWDRIVDREIWLRLAKMSQAGATLSTSGRERLDELSKLYPEWRLAEDERDEFPSWMGEGEEWRTFVATPRRRRELIDWLKQQPSPDDWQEDDWRQRCRDNFPTTACALCALAREDVWPAARWREALQAWAEEKLIKRSWRYMGPVLAAAPDDLLEATAHSLSWWLQAIAKTFIGHEAIFVALIGRLLRLAHKDGVDTDDPVMRAINHPVGQVTDALLRWWYRSSPEDQQGLPDELKQIFTKLCDTQFETFRHGRVLLAAHVVALFRVDPEWATQHLLPLFDWQRPENEARAAWEGFLWSPRLYRPLIEAIKPAFLASASHYEALGKHGEQYAALLTFAALDPSDLFTTSELANATRALPQQGLHKAAQTLARAIEGAGEQRADYWANRVVPYIRSIWPKSREHVSAAIAGSLARVCVAAKEAFPQALSTLRAWLQPLEFPENLLHQMHDANLCQQFPVSALTFLDLVIGDSTHWPPTHLRDCLVAIEANAAQSELELTDDRRYQRLIEYLRRFGQ